MSGRSRTTRKDRKVARPPRDAHPVIALEPVPGHPRLQRFTDDGIALVERLACGGHTNAAIAAHLRIDRGTFRDIRDRDPRVAEALAWGRAALESELVDIMLRAARKGNWVAALALGKTRCGWREGTEREGDAAQVNVNIVQLPAAMSHADYMRSLAPAPADALPPAPAALPAQLGATTTEDES